MKVVSYCTSLGAQAAKIVVQYRHVNLKTLGEFIDVDEAKQRNAIALVLMPEKQAEEGVIPAGVSEEAIDKKLVEIKNKN